MKTKTTPAPRRAGTATRTTTSAALDRGDRARSERLVAERLDYFRENDPAALAKAMKLLARLVVRARRRRKE